MRRTLGPALMILSLLAAPTWATGQEAPAAKPAKAKAKKGRAPRRPARARPKTYMGRPIAETMSYLGADWLVRPEREDEEQPEAMLDALKIKAGMTVADIGAGVGYTSLRLARRVGAEGVVLATDLQPEMLRMLNANARQAGVKNIKALRATQADTRLPEGQVDLALMVDVYHESSDPEALLKGIRKALKPGGRLVLVEFRGEDPEVPIKPEHKMTVAQVRKEVEPQGFTFKEQHEFLPWQHILIFEKPAEQESKPKVDAAGM